MMVPAVREWRHLLLMTAIIAALPLLVYPNSVGLNLGLGMAWYIFFELIYFYVMFRLLNPHSANRPATAAALLSLVGRLCLSATFFILLLALGSVRPGAALAAAFASFKPALLLFSLTAPVIYNSSIKEMVSGKSGGRRQRQVIRQETVSLVQHDTATPKRSADPQPTTDYFDHSFEGAVRHVGEYSGVICALLIDHEGLLVAQFSRDHEDGDMWAALALRIVEELDGTLAKAGAGETAALEFRVDDKRFNLLHVDDMWLLSIAVATSDELEKIRMQQAAEMISKRYHEKYSNLHISETEREYAGSTVGA